MGVALGVVLLKELLRFLLCLEVFAVFVLDLLALRGERHGTPAGGDNAAKSEAAEQRSSCNWRCHGASLFLRYQLAHHSPESADPCSDERLNW